MSCNRRICRKCRRRRDVTSLRENVCAVGGCSGVPFPTRLGTGRVFGQCAWCKRTRRWTKLLGGLCAAGGCAPPAPPATEKHCRRCRQWWPLTPQFWARNSAPGWRGGWRSTCKACRSERRAELVAGAPRATP